MFSAHEMKYIWYLPKKSTFYFFNILLIGYTLLYVHSSFAIIFMEKKELIALFSCSSWCLQIVVWLFLAVLWVFSAVYDCGIS